MPLAARESYEREERAREGREETKRKDGTKREAQTRESNGKEERFAVRTKKPRKLKCNAKYIHYTLIACICMNNIEFALVYFFVCKVKFWFILDLVCIGLH